MAAPRLAGAASPVSQSAASSMAAAEEGGAREVSVSYAAAVREAPPHAPICGWGALWREWRVRDAWRLRGGDELCAGEG